MTFNAKFSCLCDVFHKASLFWSDILTYKPENVDLEEHPYTPECLALIGINTVAIIAIGIEFIQ